MRETRSQDRKSSLRAQHWVSSGIHTCPVAAWALAGSCLHGCCPEFLWSLHPQQPQKHQRCNRGRLEARPSPGPEPGMGARSSRPGGPSCPGQWPHLPPRQVAAERSESVFRRDQGLSSAAPRRWWRQVVLLASSRHGAERQRLMNPGR